MATSGGGLLIGLAVARVVVVVVVVRVVVVVVVKMGALDDEGLVEEGTGPNLLSIELDLACLGFFSVTVSGIGSRAVWGTFAGVCRREASLSSNTGSGGGASAGGSGGGRSSGGGDFAAREIPWAPDPCGGGASNGGGVSAELGKTVGVGESDFNLVKSRGVIFAMVLLVPPVVGGLFWSTILGLLVVTGMPDCRGVGVGGSGRGLPGGCPPGLCAPGILLPRVPMKGDVVEVVPTGSARGVGVWPSVLFTA